MGDESRGALGHGDGGRRDRAECRGHHVRADRRRRPGRPETTERLQDMLDRGGRGVDDASRSPASARSRRSATTPRHLAGAHRGPKRHPADRLLRRRHVPGADRRHVKDFDLATSCRDPARSRHLSRAARLRRGRRAPRRSRTPGSSNGTYEPDERGVAMGGPSAGRSCRSSSTMSRDPLAERRPRRCTAPAAARACSTAPEHRRLRRSRGSADAQGR